MVHGIVRSLRASMLPKVSRAFENHFCSQNCHSKYQSLLKHSNSSAITLIIHCTAHHSSPSHPLNPCVLTFHFTSFVNTRHAYIHNHIAPHTSSHPYPALINASADPGTVMKMSFRSQSAVFFFVSCTNEVRKHF